MHGQVCAVIVMKKGNRRVRVWVDRKTGALMQAEEMADGRTLRRLWGTRIKKFGDRWMANTMEVETIGTKAAGGVADHVERIAGIHHAATIRIAPQTLRLGLLHLVPGP